eukprot:2474929-Prymnesium_polylepis.1
MPERCRATCRPARIQPVHTLPRVGTANQRSNGVVAQKVEVEAALAAPRPPPPHPQHGERRTV